MFVVVAQDVADILTEEAFDALAEFLDTFDVLLLHIPGAVCIVRLTRLERLDLLAWLGSYEKHQSLSL